MTTKIELQSLEDGNTFIAERVLFDKTINGMKIQPTWGSLVTIKSQDGSEKSFRLLWSDPNDVADVITGNDRSMAQETV